MRIQASVGNAPKTESLSTSVYSLKLIAQSIGEREWLAALYRAVKEVNPETQELKAMKPQLQIVEMKND